MKEITNTRSTRKGIVFYSNTMPELAVHAFVDAKGEIHSHLTDILSSFGISDSEELQVQKILNRGQLKVLNILLVVISAFAFRSVSITLGVIYFSLFCSKNLLHFIEVALSLKVGAMQSVARFHAAEHMALNAYHKLQRIPTLEEIKHFSRFSQNCGSMTMLRPITLEILTSIGIACLDVLNPVVYVFLIVIACPLLVSFVDKIGLLKLLQVFLTSKPTDLELNVAIKGLSEFERMEEEIQKETLGKPVCFSFGCDDCFY